MLTCKYCPDYDGCPYHAPSDYTPYNAVGYPFGYAVEDEHDE